MTMLRVRSPKSRKASAAAVALFAGFSVLVGGTAYAESEPGSLAKVVETFGDRVRSRGEPAEFTVQVNPQVQVRVRQQYMSYLVSGQTIAEVYKSLLSTPLDTEQGKAYGITYATTKPGWQFVYTDDTCSVHSFGVDLDLVIVVPELINSPISFAEMALWKSYADGVMTHEKIHAQDFIDATTRMAQQAAVLPEVGDCSVLQSVLEQIVSQEFAWLNARAHYVDEMALGMPVSFQ
jgi:predicted secreted Zn-dependent protease